MRKPRIIHVELMGDLFHPSLPESFQAKVFNVMRNAEQHTFLILTKRAARMQEMLSRWDHGGLLGGNAYGWVTKPLPNVWLGVSVENQETADERIPLLLQTPAALRFVSVEPMLGPVKLTDLPVPWESIADAGLIEPHGAFRFDSLHECDDEHFFNDHPKVDWVICGGESGPKARPMHPDWVRSLRDQCQAAGVNFAFKQWGEWLPIAAPHLKQKGLETMRLLQPDGRSYQCTWTQAISSHGQDWAVQRVGKKAAGRMLDGREWLEMPEAKKRP